MKIKRKGYTVVELVIVIVVIGILATLSLMSYNNLQRRAKVSAVADGLVKVEKAFQLWAVTDQLKTWPADPYTSGGVKLQELIDTTNLKGFLSTPPAVQGVQTQDWFYDNDPSTPKTTTCGQNYLGVNIVIRFVSDADLILQLDQLMDDGDLNCGRIRSQDQRIFLVLSRTSTVEFVK